MPDFTAVPGSAARIWIDEFELSQQSSGAEFQAELTTESYNIMGQSAVQQYAATPSFSIPHHGYYTGHGATPNLGYFEEALYARLGTTLPVTVTLILGPITYTMFGSWGTQLTIDAPVEGLITMDGNWASPDSIRRGAFVASQAFPTQGLNSTPVDLGAANIANAIVVHAHGFTGAEVVTVAVQTASTVNGSYTPWLTASLTGPKAAVVLGGGAHGQFARALVTLPGGLPTGVNVMAAMLYI